MIVHPEFWTAVATISPILALASVINAYQLPDVPSNNKVGSASLAVAYIVNFVMMGGQIFIMWVALLHLVTDNLYWGVGLAIFIEAVGMMIAILTPMAYAFIKTSIETKKLEKELMAMLSYIDIETDDMGFPWSKGLKSSHQSPDHRPGSE